MTTKVVITEFSVSLFCYLFNGTCSIWRC